MQIRGQMKEAKAGRGHIIELVAIAQLTHARSLYADRLASREQESDPTSDAKHTQSHDEGWHTQASNHETVDEASQQATGQSTDDASQNDEPEGSRGGHMGDDQGRANGGQTQHIASGEINAT